MKCESVEKGFLKYADSGDDCTNEAAGHIELEFETGKIEGHICETCMETVLRILFGQPKDDRTGTAGGLLNVDKTDFKRAY